MNVQFAIQGKTIYVLEVNPRASRTVPFISKATGVELAKIAALCMVGKTLRELNAREVEMKHVAVKESVFPFARFPGVDVILGPEMKSTGEVMGIANDYYSAFAKSELAAGSALPTSGTVFVSVKAEDKPAKVDLVINTTFGKKEIADSFSIRRESLMHSVPYYTTVQAARMAVGAIEVLVRGKVPVTALQDALGLKR